MRRIRQKVSVIIAGLLLGFPISVFVPRVEADATSSPSLVVSQLKITSANGQFITLYNATNTALDMSKYQLEYFNNYDLTKATSSRLISLAGTLPAHSYYMVNDDSLLLCYQLTIDSISLGLSSTAGFIEVLGLNQNSPGGSATQTLGDYVGWSKSAAPGAQTLPANTSAFLQRQPLDSQNNPTVTSPGSGSWQSVQPDPNKACGLISATGTPTNVQAGLNQLLPSTEPPATVVTVDSEDSSTNGLLTPALPGSDIGLKSPSLTEILPNPNGTGNDGTDEFIELYNSNNVAFDLTGFSLQAGTTSLHVYSFPSGSLLPAQSFTAFYSSDTSLSLSNSGGQVMLLDPFGNPISSSDIYGMAKDGQAWALAKGKWYWTTTPTPNMANIINLPAVTKKLAKKSAKTKTAKSLSVKSTKGKLATSSAQLASSQSAVAAKVPIHFWTLAMVASAAILYGAYEYRTDLANRVHQLKVHLSDRIGTWR